MFRLLVLVVVGFTQAFVRHGGPLWGLRRSRVASDVVRMCTSGGPLNAPSDIVPAQALERGVVLLAQPNEFNHFLIKAAVLLFDYGSPRGSRGVILERATAFTMGETTPNAGPFEANTLFMGGSDGTDTAMMFHKYDLQGFSKAVGAGLYVGGMKEARELVLSRAAKPRDFKFIFNNVEWAPGLLEREVAEGRWDLAVLPPDLVLEQGSGVGSLWAKARNTLRNVGALRAQSSPAEDAEVKEAEPWDQSGQPLDDDDEDDGDDEEDDDEPITDGYGSMTLQ